MWTRQRMRGSWSKSCSTPKSSLERSTVLPLPSTASSNTLNHLTHHTTHNVTMFRFAYHPPITTHQVPIMLRSTFCVLSEMDDKGLTEVGECQFDQGGYFIINGSEKVRCVLCAVCCVLRC